MPTRRITYSDHARDRMVERRISIGQVERTIDVPDRLSRQKGKVIAERLTSEGNTIRVIYIEQQSADGRAVHVITVIRISGGL